MSRIMKIVLITSALLAALSCALLFRGKVNEADARRMAEEKFLKVCANFKLDQTSYTGPVVTNVPGFPFEFEWKKKPGDVGDGILIIVNDAGEMNASFVPQSGATNVGGGQPKQ